MSQFLTLDEARNWLHLYRNSPKDSPSEEDKEIDSNVDFLISFSEGYIVHGVGPWIRDTVDADVKTKVSFLMKVICNDLYEKRAFTEEKAKESVQTYIVKSSINQLHSLNPNYQDNSIQNKIENVWDYI